MSYIGNQSGRIIYTNLNKFKGVVSDLTALTAVTGASSGDMYKVEDSGHAHMYDGTQWVDMGLIVGPQGVKGTGITSIVQSAGDGSEGTVDTYTITYDDTSTSTCEVRNGTAGTIDHFAKTGTEGITDTYTAYADAAETQPLGSFEVYNGISAYESAVNNGFVGTEEEWLISLKGEVEEAPIDDKTYGRKNAGWIEVEGDPTNLSQTTTANTLTIHSSTGDDVELPAATSTKAGLMSAADKQALYGVSAVPSLLFDNKLFGG